MTDRDLSALERILRVLQALNQESRVSDIARVASLPVSTVHRILTELTDLNWVIRSGERGYGPGPQMLRLAGGALEATDYARLADEPMSELRNRTGLTVHLGVRTGDEAVYVAKLDGLHAYRMRSHVGMIVPLHSTGLGKAMLARLTDEEVLAIAERTGLPRMTPTTITDPSRLIEELGRIRERGWSSDDSENEQHTRCVSAAVFDARGRPVAGLSLSGLEFDLPWDEAPRLAAEVIETAARVSARLGSPAHQ